MIYYSGSTPETGPIHIKTIYMRSTRFIDDLSTISRIYKNSKPLPLSLCPPSLRVGGALSHPPFGSGWVGGGVADTQRASERWNSDILF
jgi:hypothetical protein